MKNFIRHLIKEILRNFSKRHCIIKDKAKPKYSDKDRALKLIAMFWQQFFATGALNSRKCLNLKKRVTQKVARLFGVVVEFCGFSERSIKTVKTNERDLSLSLYLGKIKMKSSIIKIPKQPFLSLFSGFRLTVCIFF